MEISIIENSEFDKIRELSTKDYQYLELYSTMLRYNCFVEVKKAGSGHLGSSFSAMDIITYLYLRELNVLEVGLNSNDRDIYFSSKGHDVPGLYSLLHSLGFIETSQLMKLRKLGGLDGHPDVRIPGIESNTGSLGMGISKGKGMAIAKKLNNYGGRVFVLTGDGEFQEGQIYESLQTTSHQKVTNLNVIIDRNKFQTDKIVNEIVNIDDLKQKVSSFGWYVDEIDGHNFSEIENALNKIKDVTDKPKFIIANTIKGKGISFLENYTKNQYGEVIYKWHSGAPDDEYFELGINELKQKIRNLSEKLNVEINYKIIEQLIKQPSSKKIYITETFGKRLCEIANERKDLIVLDGDLSADCKLRDFEYQYPERFIENGISEQDMVSTAGGLARMGMLPLVSSFASFLVSRANEHIYNNACEHTKIIYACHFAGIIPAGPGKSHQSVRDISLLNAIPNMVIIQPGFSVEMQEALDYAVYIASENVALRMNIGPSPQEFEPENYKLEFGKGTTLLNGNNGILFTYGPVMLNEAVSAVEILNHHNYSLKVVNMPWLNRIDLEWFEQTIRGFDKIFVLDDHSINGGLGDLIINAVNKLNIANKPQVIKFGIEDYPECGTPFEVLNYHRLDAKSLAEQILNQELTIKNTKTIYSEEAPQ